MGGYVEPMMQQPTREDPGGPGRLEQAFETLKVDTRGAGLGSRPLRWPAGSAASVPPMAC